MTDANRRWLTSTFETVGAVLITTGFYLAYPPLAWVVGGLFAFWVSVALETGVKGRADPVVDALARTPLDDDPGWDAGEPD